MSYVPTTLTDCSMAMGTQSSTHSQSGTDTEAEYSEPINSLMITPGPQSTGPQSSTHIQRGTGCVAEYSEPVNSLSIKTAGPQSSAHSQRGTCAVADHKYDEPIIGHKYENSHFHSKR